MKCLLVSFFNSHNIGDCIIAESLYNTVSKEYETEKYSYSGDPYTITDINDIIKTNSKNSNKIKKNVYRLIKKTKLEKLISNYKLIKNKDIFKELEEKMKNIDLLVIGGGNMIFDTERNSASAKKFDSFITLAKKNNKKIFAIALGIGPFFNSQQEKDACQALSKCDYISFRDQKSYDIYVKHIKKTDNVYVTVDPVFFLPNYNIKKESTKKTIGVNLFNSKLIHASKEEYDKLVNEYCILIEKLRLSLNVKVILFSTDLTDYETIYKVYNQLSNKKNIEVHEINGFNDLIELYGKLTILVGMRMHSMIIAITQHIPVVGISWQPKVDSFFNIINKKENVFDYNEIYNSIDDIVDCCKDNLVNEVHKKNDLISTLSSIKEKEKIDSTILSQIKKISENTKYI